MKRRYAKRQRGAALLAMLAVIALGASWYLVSRLNANSGGVKAFNQSRNAIVLNRAKQALIGYLAAQAVKTGENNPGALPCPEAAGYFDNPTQDGQTASSCTLPKVGRFPWRTIGTDKLVDASGEPLWYVVGPGWAYTGSNPTINSNTVGQLTVDGVPNAAVALIIAPGPAIAVAAAAGCTVWNQVRATTGTPDWRNYLECENATSPADSAFVTNGPSGSFNDQVLQITVADIMPAIEAAVANRIEREIVPVLKSVYGDATWGTSSTNPAFPFAAPFADPTTSSYLGQISPPSLTSLYQGLLPFNYHSGSCGGDVRCSPDTITWNSVPSLSSSGPGPGYLTTPTSSPSSPLPNCTVSGSTPMCEGYYYYGGGLNISMTDALTTQIANGLRTFTLASHTGTVQALRWTGSAWVDLGTQSAAVSRNLASNGAANFIASGSLPTVPTWGYYYIRGSRPTISDHSILSATDPTTGWFVRNEWYRLLYYAVARGHTAEAISPSNLPACPTTNPPYPFNSSCLSVANVAPANSQRAILILTGRSINGSARPSAALADYLEFGNAAGAFERRTVRASVATPVAQRFNDRIVVIDAN